MRSERFADLADALCGNVSVDAVLGAFAEPAAQGMVPRGDIDRLFAGERVEDILERLEAGNEWAVKAAAMIRTKSPLSIKIAVSAPIGAAMTEPSIRLYALLGVAPDADVARLRYAYEQAVAEAKR